MAERRHSVGTAAVAGRRRRRRLFSLGSVASNPTQRSEQQLPILKADQSIPRVRIFNPDTCTRPPYRRLPNTAGSAAKGMKKDDELSRDRVFEFETDDEENEAENHGHFSQSSSSSSSPHSLGHDHTNEEDEGHESYQGTWPQSYRQSIDVMSSVMSPRVGFFTEAGSSLVHVGSSFLRAGPERLPSFNRPLLRPTPSLPDVPVDGQIPCPFPPSKVSFAKSSYLRSSYLPDIPPSPECSTTQAIINGINVLCGVGILTTPYAIKEGGWLGITVLFVFAVISCYTGLLLKECLDSSPGLLTYPDIGHAAFGMPGRLCISIILYLELYACCVEYITLVSNSLESLFPGAHISFAGVHLNPHQLFAITTAIMVLPTVWLRDLSLLSYLSAGGVVASILVAICLIWVGVVDEVGFHHSGTLLDLSNFPVALGVYGFCYSGHSVFPNIYSSMKTQSQFPAVLVTSFIICTFLYFGVAVVGFLMFGESVKSQFTLNMPRQYLSSKVAAWTTVVNPLSKYALTMTPVALSLEELLPSTQDSHFIVIVIRTVLVLSTLVVSLSVPYFGFVMAFLGSLFTMLVALILPCACYLSIKHRTVNFLQITLCTVIIVVGSVSASIGSYTVIKQIADQSE